MIFEKLELEGVILISPNKITDNRGYFSEIFRDDLLEKYLGKKFIAIQENESFSYKNVIRGLHFQKPPFSQAKLIRVIEGEIIDFVVDIRHGSPTFSKHISVKLSKSNYKQLFIPRGFAHGLYVTSDYAISNYKVDNYFSKDHDSGINLFDKDLDLYKQIISYKTIISQKDKNLLKLSQLDSFYKINNE